LSRELLGLVIIVATALLSSVIYVIGGGYRRKDQNEIGDRGGFILGSFMRSWLYWFLGPLERLAVRLRMSPSTFNLLGVALGVTAGFCFGSGDLNSAGWLVLLSGAVDVLDGRIARAQGLASPRGAFLDSTLDRFAEVGAFVGLAVFYHDSIALTIVIASGMGGSLLVSYTRARGEGLGVVCKAGVMQRAERILLIGLGGILDPILGYEPGALLAGALIILAAGVVGTAVYRTLWIWKRIS